jgi:hypothetical protein
MPKCHILDEEGPIKVFMTENIPIKLIPSIQCGKLDCKEPALSGQVFCYEHTYPRLHQRDKREWDDLGDGAYRRKIQRGNN